ncbi:hypothetical protein AAFF_G00293440, partial [Aldrovandia affinis]
RGHRLQLRRAAPHCGHPGDGLHPAPVPGGECERQLLRGLQPIRVGSVRQPDRWERDGHPERDGAPGQRHPQHQHLHGGWRPQRHHGDLQRLLLLAGHRVGGGGRGGQRGYLLPFHQSSTEHRTARPQQHPAPHCSQQQAAHLCSQHHEGHHGLHPQQHCCPQATPPPHPYRSAPGHGAGLSRSEQRLNRTRQAGSVV